jgi:hypothetical protein
MVGIHGETVRALSILFSRVMLKARFVLVAGFLCFIGTVRAQDSTMLNLLTAQPSTETKTESSVTETTRTTSIQEPEPPTEGPDPSVETQRDGAGVSAMEKKFHYGVHLTLRGVYDDNINISHDNRIDDYYIAIEPGITIGYGDIIGREGNYIRLDYQASIFLFVDHDDADSVQHLIHLEAFHRFSRLALTLGQDVSVLDGADVNLTTSGTSSTTGTIANIDVGGRTRFTLGGTRLGWTYDLSGKTFLSGEFLNTLYAYQDDLISSDSFSGSLYINYNYSPKLAVGIGGTGGYNWVDSPTPEQTFEQANVRATYQATGKISLNASAGAEFRQFGDNGASDRVSPVYELGVTYLPFDGTTITLTGSRRTLNSAIFAGQDFASTNIIAGIRQRMFERVYLSVSGGYENSDYFSALAGISASRHDNYYFVEPAVDVSIMRFWTAGAYYLHRENESNFTAFSFYDNQIGLRTTLTF